MPRQFLWHDYETFGTHPALDRPAQFAALKTDSELNIVDEPLEWSTYAKHVDPLGTMTDDWYAAVDEHLTPWWPARQLPS